LRLFFFGGYGLALAALALGDFGAYDSYPTTVRLLSAEAERRPELREKAELHVCV